MSDLRIKTCVVGQVGTNCYIVYKEERKEGIIVDPGDNSPYILNKLKELQLTPQAILLTHGHFDHIMAVEDIKRSFPDIEVCAGKKEQEVLLDPDVNLSTSFGASVSIKADRLLDDGEVISIGGLSFKTLFTPGHTCGSVSYLIEGEEVLLSGDTLFFESLGRTDFPTGSSAQIVTSIRERLFVLPEQIRVCSGHGEQTSIGHEKVYNPVARFRG